MSKMRSSSTLQNFLLAVFLLLTASCGAKAPTDGGSAALQLDITFPAPDLRAFATADTAAELTKLQPAKLLVLVCDNVTLSREVRAFCSVSQNDYNYRILFDDFSAGAGTAEDVPPAKDQVIVVQGLAADNSVTYQGFATLPTIEPRVTYNVSIAMGQIVFPDLVKPEAPIILEPASAAVTVPPTATQFVFKGTRVANTRLRVATPASFNLGGVRQFNGDEPPMYDETVAGDGTIEWVVTIELPTDRSVAQNFTFTFDVSRTGEEKFSDKVSVTIALCSVAFPACSL